MAGRHFSQRHCIGTAYTLTCLVAICWLLVWQLNPIVRATAAAKPYIRLPLWKVNVTVSDQDRVHASLHVVRNRAAIRYSIKGQGQYLQVQRTFAHWLNWSGQRGISMVVTTETPSLPGTQLKLTLLQSDGQWWSAVKDHVLARKGRYRLFFSFRALRLDPWGAKGNGHPIDLRRINACRIQISRTARGEVAGRILVSHVKLVPKQHDAWASLRKQDVPSRATSGGGYWCLRHFYPAIAQIADRILLAQIPSGGICENIAARKTRGGVLMTYCFGGLALAKAYQMTGNRQYLRGARGFVEFWFRHQNLTPDRQGLSGTFYTLRYLGHGRISDLIYSQGAGKGGPGYDASDADPLFVVRTAYRYYKLTGDLAFLQKYKKNFSLVGREITATLQPDGLTWAEPKWKVEYVMDACEVWTGYRDLSRIFGSLGNSRKALRYSRLAARVRTGILAMWNAQAGWYYWAKFPGGGRQPCNWNVIYPDTLEQIWPTLWGVVPPRATPTRKVWSQFKLHHPHWTHRLNWPCFGRVAIEMGDVGPAMIQTGTILRAKVHDDDWSVDSMYFTMLNCCLPFDVKGGAYVEPGSVRTSHHRLVASIHSSNTTPATLRLWLPGKGGIHATINGRVCESIRKHSWVMVPLTFTSGHLDCVSVEFPPRR